MSDAVEIVLAGAPMGKQRVRVSQDGGHVYTPERTVTYEGRLAYAAQQIMGDRPLLDGPLSVDMLVRLPITISWPKKRQEAARAGRIRPTKKPDADNYAKMLDALNLIVWADDSQIVRLTVEKHYHDAPGMWIKVRPLATEGVFA